MKKNKLLQRQSEKETDIIRILDLQDNKVYIIDCIKRTMPKWIEIKYLSEYTDCTEEKLLEVTKRILPDISTISTKDRKVMHKRFTAIAGIIPFISDGIQRNQLIAASSYENSVTKQTIRNYLCLYLVYQKITALVPKQHEERELSQDEKNMRWGLNKFFYTKHKNSLKTAYTMMLQKKYCDSMGKLLPEYPSFNQFRYFYRKYNNMQTYYISRNDIKSYERNNRPLLGDGVQQYASNVGVGMFDATICDIYLVNDNGNLAGRPILTACVDAYSSLCMGYFLSWEGGVYSLRGLLLNIIEDKREHCMKYGIMIDNEDWDCCQLPAEFITDMGTEYISANFEQVADLGVTIVNLPSYRPELKGVIEKFFDCIQGYFKPYLKGRGVIEPDFRERGSHDYRKDACLTIADFEKIVIHCILYYNNKRIIENYPYTDIMLSEQVKPYAGDIWKWGKVQPEANLINVNTKELILTLLPRTEGKFSRFGLKANQMRYHCEGYTEQYLQGGIVTIAYNPDDVSHVWLIEDSGYVMFDLIETRYKGKTLLEVQDMHNCQKEIVKSVVEENLQAKIELAEHIQTISSNVDRQADVNLKNIRNTRKHEQNNRHIDYVKEGRINE